MKTSVSMLPWCRPATNVSVSESHANKPDLTPAVLVLLGGLVLIVVVQVAWAMAAIRQPSELLYSEAVVHDKAARVARGDPLYQPLDRPPYTVAAYTPLYYWLSGGAMALVGPGFGPGRAISLGAAVLASAAVGCLAARRTGDLRAGIFAALLFAALGLPATPSWSALYREHVLGVALSAGSIAVLAGGRRWVVPAAVLAALALLTKQTLLAPALAGGFWLWSRDRRAALRFAGLYLGLVLGTCATLELTTGAFFSNAADANVNPFSLAAVGPNVAIFLLFQGGIAVVAGLYLLRLCRGGRPAEDHLLAWYWLASLPSLVALAKVGAAMNYWFEFAAAGSVLATLELWATLPKRRTPRLAATVVLIAISVVLYAPLTGIAAIPRFRQLWPDTERSVELTRLIERARAEPREVLADPLDVVTLAGRRIFLEPLIFTILQSEGRWDPDPLVARICAGDVGLLVLDAPLDLDRSGPHGYPSWSPEVLAALRQTMILDAEVDGRYVYVPSGTVSDLSWRDRCSSHPSGAAPPTPGS